MGHLLLIHLLFVRQSNFMTSFGESSFGGEGGGGLRTLLGRASKRCHIKNRVAFLGYTSVAFLFGRDHHQQQQLE